MKSYKVKKKKNNLGGKEREKKTRRRERGELKACINTVSSCHKEKKNGSAQWERERRCEWKGMRKEALVSCVYKYEPNT